MFDEGIFKFNIDNIKSDLAIEGMSISESDINIFKAFTKNEINMNEMVNMIKNNPLGE